MCTGYQAESSGGIMMEMCCAGYDEEVLNSLSISFVDAAKLNSLDPCWSALYDSAAVVAVKR